MSLSKGEIQQIARETTTDALIGIHDELRDMRGEITALDRKHTASLQRLMTTVEKVLEVISGDDKITKEPGLITRVRDLEEAYKQMSLAKAKFLGMVVGAGAVAGVVYKAVTLALGK